MGLFDFISNPSPYSSQQTVTNTAKSNLGTLAPTTTSSRGGTFWAGADGKVYVQGDQGTNAAGNWDDNSLEYWQDKGYTQIADPSRDIYGPYAPKTLGSSNTRNISTPVASASGGAPVSQDAQYQSQIDRINSLLGIYSPQLQSGRQSIDTNYNEQGRRLQEQQTRANTGYDEQDALAKQGRSRGYDQVDNYAYNSANGLNRIFQNANAGQSSVARLLAPSLVGKAADSRRLEVTQTANQNLGGIKKAREDATADFNYANQDLENNRGYAKDALEKGIVQQEADQYGQRLAIEQQAGRDTTGTQNEINSRTARLAQLFGAGQFNPNYSARAVTPKAVALNDYNLDPMAIQAAQNPQASGGFYAQQLKKKNELRVR